MEGSLVSGMRTLLGFSHFPWIDPSCSSPFYIYTPLFSFQLLFIYQQLSIRTGLIKNHSMQSEQEMDVLEVNKQLLEQLEDMGFSQAQAAWGLHHSGNSSLVGAILWIIDHENEPDVDQMPSIAVNIDIESPPAAQTTEEMQTKAQELRNQARKKKEEEEKKLEWEREKERIRAGKETQEAKRIAEENERKRYLALRKAEKEEEKRAREKIRQKLEADKAERRRMLGLPPLSPTPVQSSRPVVQEKKNYAPVIFVSKAEQLRECLRNLRRNHRDDEAAVQRAFQTLLIYIGNVAKNPDNAKFRKIRMSNPLFLGRVGRLKGGIEFLELCGFKRIEGGRFLSLPRDDVDMAVLNSAGSVLKSAIGNPFFGLLSYG